MRFSVLPLLFLLVTAGLSAQEVIEQGFCLELTGHHGSRRISAGSGVVFSELERQDSLESGVPGYGVGLMYTSRVNKIGFTTGVRFLETGFDVAVQSDRRAGSNRTFSQEVRARYISLPFELNFYQDITEKDRVFFALGLAAHLHLKTKTTQTDFIEGEQTGTMVLGDDPDNEFRSPIISLNTSLGFDRKFSERWSIRFEPFFQFFLQGNLKTNFDSTNRNYYQLGARVLARRAIF